MAKELVVENEVEIDSQHIRRTPYGLEIEGKPSTEEWYDTFQKVSQIHGMSQFYLGDLVVCAEYEWGDKYTDLIDLTGYDYKTLANYASVARRFSPQFREQLVPDVGKNGLPAFGAFDAVTSIDDDRAAYFLRMVSNGKWSIAKLREEVKRYKNGGALPDGKEDVPENISSFKEITKNLFKGYVPKSDEKYDTVSWLIEIRDWANELLHDMGVEEE